MFHKPEKQAPNLDNLTYITKAQLRSGRRRLDEVPDLQQAPEQPEDILFDVPILGMEEEAP